MGFLNDMFGHGTEEKVSVVVDETVKKGKAIGKKVVAKGKVAAKNLKLKKKILN